jgi:60S ribosomal export protein NMD3
MSFDDDPFSETHGRILCCMCGVQIPPNPSNMCVVCLRNQVDITEGIPKQVQLQWCKGCGRYFQPPTLWVEAPLESPRLLTLCLKKLRGLQKVKLVDAGFIWTEPHSRRLKVKLSIQREVFSGTILQQTFVVEYMIVGQQCPDCQKVEAKNTWTAVAQVRQKVNHKRTFYFLEQLILKHGAHQHTINIREFPDGLDFYFHNRSHCVKFVEFLQAVVPLRYKTAQKLISHDPKSNVYNYKYTFSVEIAPICRDDLVCLPRRVANALGNVNPLLLCAKVGTALRFVDASTLKTVDITATGFWQCPFRAIASKPQLVEYVVLDIERHQSRATNRKLVLCDVQVARARDFGNNDRTFLGRTHLGHLLQPGDSALGYDVSGAVFNSSDVDALVRERQLPDVILVRKFYPARRSGKMATRHWRLKALSKEKADHLDSSTATHGRRADREAAIRDARDFEQFLQELEEDPELRSQINLYKMPDAERILARRRAVVQAVANGQIDPENDDGDGDDDDQRGGHVDPNANPFDALANVNEPADPSEFPEIELSELMADLSLDVAAYPSSTTASSSSSSSPASSSSFNHYDDDGIAAVDDDDE